MMAEYFERIDHLWAWISFDKDGEGVMAALFNNNWTPMIAADEARLHALRPYVRQIVKESGRAARLVKFTTRQELEIIEP